MGEQQLRLVVWIDADPSSQEKLEHIGQVVCTLHPEASYLVEEV